MSDPAHEPNVHPDLSLGEITALELFRTRHPRATEALMSLDDEARSRVLDLLSAESIVAPTDQSSAQAEAASAADSSALSSALSLKSDPVVSVEKVAPLAYGSAWVVSVSLALAGIALVRFVSQQWDESDGFYRFVLLLLVIAIVTGIISYSRLFIDLCRTNGRILAELRDREMDRGGRRLRSHDEK